MVIIYMKIKHTLAILLLLTLATFTHANNSAANAEIDPSLLNQPPRLQLMDLTELMKALGVTYDQLNQNQPTLNTPAPSSTPAPATGNTNSSSSAAAVNNRPQTSTPATTQTAPRNDDSVNARTSPNGSSATRTNDNPRSNTPTSTQTQTQTPTRTTSTPSPTTPTPTPTPTPTRTQTQTQIQTQTQTQTQTGTNRPTQTSTSAQIPRPPPTRTTTTTSTPSTITSNAPLTIGPGPQDKNLPPVIDISRLVDITSSVPSTPAQTQNSQQSQTNSRATAPTPTTVPTPTPTTVPTPTPATVSTQSTVTSSRASQTITTQTTITPSSTTTTQTRPENRRPLNDDEVSKPTNRPTTPTPAPISTIISIPIPTPNPSPATNTQQTVTLPVSTPVNQNNVNDVYIAPVVSTPIKTDRPDSRPAQHSPPIIIRDDNRPSRNNLVSEQRKESSAPPASYQYWNSSPDAIYKITPSYRAFSKYFIITTKDPYLSNIQSFLVNNYGNYLSGSQLTAGFRLYNTFGDNSLDYQLLISSNYGTFVAIMTYWPVTGNIQLKSLSILNFFIMEIDDSNCQERDTLKQNCRVCQEGFRNFYGRCQPYDRFCVEYLSDECGRCEGHRRLLNGICQ